MTSACSPNRWLNLRQAARTGGAGKGGADRSGGAAIAVARFYCSIRGLGSEGAAKETTDAVKDRFEGAWI